MQIVIDNQIVFKQEAAYVAFSHSQAMPEDIALRLFLSVGKKIGRSTNWPVVSLKLYSAYGGGGGAPCFL